MAIILSERAFAFSLAEIYYERAKKNAELAAKKELVSLATKIDTAASNGKMEVKFALSSNITKYRKQTELFDIAIAIIEADIESAGYSMEKDLDPKSGAILGYIVGWGSEESNGGEENQGGEGGNGGEPDPVDPEPVDPVEPDPVDPVDPEPIDDEPTLTPAEKQDDNYYQVVDVAVGGNQSPVEEGWFELIDGIYYISEDTAVDMEKTYYELSGWEPVDPDDLEPLPEP